MSQSRSQGLDRLGFLTASAGVAIFAATMRALPFASAGQPFQPRGLAAMNFITTTDGASIFYKDWGPRDAQPLVLITAGH